MWVRALSVTVVVLSLTVGASACGGDDSGESVTPPTVIEQIEQICLDWRGTVDERGEFPVEGFDPAKPAQRDLPAVAAYFAAGHPAAEEAIAELRGLSPPVAVTGDLDALVSALMWQLEDSKVQVAALRAGNASAFTRTLRGAASPQGAVQEASDQLGVESCAF